ncbi:MAG: glycoside hydrolase family 88 protein [Mucilaginibacter sp.]|uniref:glycoside hydrolase family 88 protein n=1 Tax=Mucilaginibacter sp. TaxID=1882438 RepID=UPI0032646693
MLYRVVILMFLGQLLLLNGNVGAQNINIQKEMGFAEKQITLLLNAHSDLTQFPFSVNENGTRKDMPSSWWCSGFFPGILWELYEYTGNLKWKTAAQHWTAMLEKEQYNISTHDLGFMLYCSYGNGYKLTKNKNYKNILKNGAKSLATRYNANVGLIRSWDTFGKYRFPVIIDNMMNLEFLMWASKHGTTNNYKGICISHADKTLQNHFRSDGSCYHVVCYSDSGMVLAKKNHQGFQDESAWARGQAWALYGFTVMYRETGKEKYLEVANKAASYILNNPNLPKDKIPYWDYLAPNIPNEERDASAAAVIASALLELQRYVPTKRVYYVQSAKKIIRSLSSPQYKAGLGENNYFILKHSVGAKTLGKEVDKPLVYADYYYLEALLRLAAIEKKQ